MITVEVVGASQLQARLAAMPEKVHASLKKKILSLSLMMESRIKEKLSGEVLNVRTGDLRRSIHTELEEDTNSIYGIVFSTGGRDNQPPYAAIQEFGGTIHRNSIAKRIGKMTSAYEIVIPERSYMRSTLNEMRSQIVEGMQEAVKEGLRS